MSDYENENGTCVKGVAGWREVVFYAPHARTGAARMHVKAMEFIEKVTAIEPKPAFFKEIMNRPSEGPNYLIFFTARSGSSWLTELLAINGGLGNPDEWFNTNICGGTAAHFGVSNVYDYVCSVSRFARDKETRVFGAEITYAQLDVFNQMANLFEIFAPQKSTFFCLRREDILKQAISLYRLASGGQGHSHQPEAKTEIPYDADKIAHWLNHLLAQEAGMNSLFDSYGIRPYFLSYEKMMANGPQSVLDFFHRRILDRSFSGDAVPPRRNTALKSPDTAEWYERFMADRGDFLREALETRLPVRSDL